MRTELYLIVARENDIEDPIYAIAVSKRSAHIAMMEILRESAIAAHEELLSEDMLEEYIRLEYTIDEPIELPLHGNMGTVIGYKPL